MFSEIVSKDNSLLDFKDENSYTPLLFAIARKKDQIIRNIMQLPFYSHKTHFELPIRTIINEIQSEYEGLLHRFKNYISGLDKEIFDLQNKKFVMLIKLYNRFPLEVEGIFLDETESYKLERKSSLERKFLNVDLKVEGKKRSVKKRRFKKRKMAEVKLKKFKVGKDSPSNPKKKPPKQKKI